MSLTLFAALCILGVDFLIYVLFQWTYGDKRRALARKIAAERKALKEQGTRPFLVASREGLTGAREMGGPTAYDEQIA
ncbi:MAG TPA: hypothetical protein VEI54_11935 [Candidatus Limnocylindrales bacterium]|nr:hypothetical protein [Candidatus Limnocylindrales bacterium]